jgi:hypothetical protein
MIKENSPALGTFEAQDKDGDSLTVARYPGASGFDFTAVVGRRPNTVNMTAEDTAGLVRFLLHDLSDQEKIALAREVLATTFQQGR